MFAFRSHRQILSERELSNPFFFLQLLRSIPYKMPRSKKTKNKDSDKNHRPFCPCSSHLKRGTGQHQQKLSNEMKARTRSQKLKEEKRHLPLEICMHIASYSDARSLNGLHTLSSGFYTACMTQAKARLDTLCVQPADGETLIQALYCYEYCLYLCLPLIDLWWT